MYACSQVKPTEMSKRNGGSYLVISRQLLVNARQQPLPAVRFCSTLSWPQSAPARIRTIPSTLGPLVCGASHDTHRLLPWRSLRGR